MLTTLEPDLLRSFLAVAETGSFTAAAQRVRRTQSAVSMQIKRLEEAIGRPVFARDPPRRVGLTRDGEVLLGHARRILQAHREALAEFDTGGQLVGEVTIGAPDDYASTCLPRILARFAADHAPRAHVSVVCQPSVELLRLLEEGTVDLALVSEGSGEPGGGRVVHREPLIWVAAAGHRAHELDPMPLAVFQPGCVFRRLMTEALAAKGRACRIAYTSVSVAGVQAALESGLAVSALLRGTVRPGGGLRLLDGCHGFPPLPDIGIVLQRARRGADAPSPLVDRLEDAILEHFAVGAGLGRAA